ncbi:MAG: AI-2E family transporter [Candidatus Baltobacteraceae bacterium]
MDRRVARLMAMGAGLLLVVLLTWVLRPLLLVIVPTGIYAVITWPLVRRLRRFMPSTLATVTANVTLAAVVGGIIIFFGPVLYGQALRLFATLPGAAGSALAALPVGAREDLVRLAAQIDVNVISWSREIFGASLSVLRSTSAVLGAALIVPVLATYLQLDLPRYLRALDTIVPEERREFMRETIAEMYAVLDGFVRAQIFVSAIVGFLIFLALQLLGIPFALAIGVLTAAIDLIPYLGGIAAIVPSVVLALASGGIAKALLVVVIILAIFELEAQVLSPQLVGRRTRLPASMVVLALLVGGELFGPLGLYLAVPVAAMARVAFARSLGA